MSTNAQARQWFSITNAADDEDVAEIEIYDAIGKSFWEKRVSATDFVQQLKGVTASTIRLKLNSPGGDVFDGVTIYNELRQHKASVEVHVNGYAASIASVIMLAGDKIVVNEGALVMIHNPSTIAWGEAKDMRESADLLDKIRDSILEIYTARTGQSAEDLTAWMDASTWMSGKEAVERGFAHEATADAGGEKFVTAQFDPRAVELLKREAPAEIAALLSPEEAAQHDREADAPAETSTPESVNTTTAISDEHARRVRHLLATL